MSLENRAGRKEVFYFENPLSFIKQDITKEKKTNHIAQNATGSINNIP